MGRIRCQRGPDITSKGNADRSVGVLIALYPGEFDASRVLWLNLGIKGESSLRACIAKLVIYTAFIGCPLGPSLPQAAEAPTPVVIAEGRTGMEAPTGGSPDEPATDGSWWETSPPAVQGMGIRELLQPACPSSPAPRSSSSTIASHPAILKRGSRSESRSRSNPSPPTRRPSTPRFPSESP